MIRFLVLLAVSAGAVAAQSQFAGTQTLIVLDNADSATFAKTKASIEANDGRIIHSLAPRLLEGYLTPRARAHIEKSIPTRLITDREITSGTFSPSESRFLFAWNQKFKPLLATRGEEDRQGHRTPSRKRNVDVGTSDYLMGNVAVAVVFVESDGSLDTDRESWTEEDQEDVFYQIRKGLDWWAEMGGYRASLSWTYEMRSVQTKYEPISRSEKEAGLWVLDCMNKLGYRGGSDDEVVRKWARDLRKLYSTDWAFVTFVVPAAHDSDAQFSDGGVAWAYGGGPYMVLSTHCDGWGPLNVWKVMAHETGHIFQALDEYEGASNGREKSGRLGVINGNHVDGGQIREKCMMKSNDLRLCEFTLGQVGWVDRDTNGVFDVDESRLSDRFNRTRIREEVKKARALGRSTGKFAEEEKVLLIEEFSQHSGWFEDQNTYIRDGEYHVFDPEGGVTSFVSNSWSDFVAEIDASFGSGDRTAGYGLLMRGQDNGDGYSFFMNAEGYYMLGKIVQGNWQMMIPWTQSEAIHGQGVDRLKVSCVGSKLSLSINDVLQKEVTDKTFPSGHVGVAVMPGVRVRYDHLFIRRP